MNHPSKLSPPKNQAPHRALNAATAGRIAIIPGLNSNSSAPIKSQAPRARAAADQMLADRNILKKPYFADLTNGAMSLPGFRDTQEQFLFAVRFFSRPMAALASRLPDSASRLDLIHNLGEEHGEGNPATAHDKTFAQFLRSIGGRGDRDTKAGPAVDAFNHALIGVCLAKETDAAFSCLGIIEYAFADISAFIGNAVVARGWVRREDLVHYNLHAEIDKRHAEELFSAVEGRFDEGQANVDVVESGLRLGLHLFDAFYADLHQLSQTRPA